MVLKLNPFISSSKSFKFRRFVPPAPAATSAIRGGTCRFPKFVMAATLSSGTTSIAAREVEKDKKPFMPPRKIHVRVTHSIPPQRIEVFKSLEDYILAHLKPVEKCWGRTLYPMDLKNKFGNSGKGQRKSPMITLWFWLET